MKPKLFATDYDGTIRFEHGINEQDLLMIKNWRAAGHKFGIVTGRSLASLYHELPKFNLDYDFLIGNNGGIIVDQDHQIIERQLIDLIEVEDIMTMLADESCLNYYVDDGIISGQMYEEDYKGIFEGFKKVPANEVLASRQVAGIKVKFATELEAQTFNTKLNPILKTAIGFVNKNFVDIVGVKASKYYGIQQVSAWLATDEVYCMGDADNDLPMLIGYQGYSLNHAPEHIKAQASACFDTLAQAMQEIMEKDE